MVAWRWREGRQFFNLNKAPGLLGSALLIETPKSRKAMATVDRQSFFVDWDLGNMVF
jgi:hypothetical protein